MKLSIFVIFAILAYALVISILYFNPITDNENIEEKQVYYPDEYDSGILNVPDYASNHATDKQLDFLQDEMTKVYNDGRLPIDVGFSSHNLNAIVIGMHPDTQNKIPREEMNKIIADITNVTVYIEFDISEDHK